MVLRKINGMYEVTRLEVGGVVVGLLRDFTYSQAAIQLQPGDLLVAFTDGISEAMNTADEEWGEDSLMQAAQACANLTASEMVSHLTRAADDFAAGAKQHDDMTLIIIKTVDSRQ
jgi:serine phosphatase RsbU (regulator of sigma subunit)